MDGLRQIMADLLAPEKAAQATAQMKELKNNQMLLPSLMQIALTDTEPQIRFVCVFSFCWDFLSKILKTSFRQ